MASSRKCIKILKAQYIQWLPISGQQGDTVGISRQVEASEGGHLRKSDEAGGGMHMNEEVTHGHSSRRWVQAWWEPVLWERA